MCIHIYIYIRVCVPSYIRFGMNYPKQIEDHLNLHGSSRHSSMAPVGAAGGESEPYRPESRTWLRSRGDLASQALGVVFLLHMLDVNQPKKYGDMMKYLYWCGISRDIFVNTFDTTNNIRQYIYI